MVLGCESIPPRLWLKELFLKWRPATRHPLPCHIHSSCPQARTTPRRRPPSSSHSQSPASLSSVTSQLKNLQWLPSALKSHGKLLGISSKQLGTVHLPLLAPIKPRSLHAPPRPRFLHSINRTRLAYFLHLNMPIKTLVHVPFYPFQISKREDSLKTGPNASKTVVKTTHQRVSGT